MKFRTPQGIELTLHERRVESRPFDRSENGLAMTYAEPSHCGGTVRLKGGRHTVASCDVDIDTAYLVSPCRRYVARCRVSELAALEVIS